MGKRGSHIDELFDLTGRVAMVTGGCQNLGLDMAEALGEAGADLVITSRSEEKARRVGTDMADYLGVKLLPLSMDVTQEESVQAGFRQVNEEYGRLDILVCNAGGGRLTGGEPSTDQRLVSDWDYVIALNLRGTFLCCRQACRIMKRQQRGGIINLASIAGMGGQNRWRYEGSDIAPNLTDYSAVKAGVIGFSQDLAAEMGKYGIRVNTISPGGFDRDWTEEFRKRYSFLTMLGRGGRDGVDLKGAVVYLASDAADYVTGHNLVVDGGFTAW